LSDKVGFSILQNETYKEDFWIVDENNEKIVICETKTYLRGFKKSGIYNLYSHREANDLEEHFPALLIINSHIIANSWKEKLRPIDPQDCDVAFKNHLLVMRSEDLLFFWNLMVEGKKTKEELLSLILNERGWLEVKKDGNLVVHKR
jgi:hypothetical protein